MHGIPCLLDSYTHYLQGAAELRHCLIFMGEHVTEQEVDMMISMLDKNASAYSFIMHRFEFL